MNNEELKDMLEQQAADMAGCGPRLALWGIVAALVFMLCSCKTRQVVITVPEVHTDTLVITKQQRDSIWLHDSIYMHQYAKGDTIYVELKKWHTKYIERLMRDTIYQATHDSIPAPYPVEVEVPAQLSRWQSFRISLGDILLVILVSFLFLLLGCAAARLRRRVNF